jgi:ABC-type phosphate/phosphonate transport system substrate-binding protein
MRARRAIYWIAFPVVGLTLATPATRAAAENIAFVTVALDDETRAADTTLRNYLHEKTHLQFDPIEMEYAAAIQRLAGWKRGSQPYVARMTPYAYVAAEMLGASFEILGTYNSKATGVTTYHSYFVVNRKNFSRPNPGLGDLLAFLRTRQARFIYHDRFSTSSYFLPALYFRSQRVFTTSEATDSSEGITSIQVSKHAGTSSDLVAQVANGNADLAAVWDGTKQKVKDARLDGQVYFIQLPDPIPNDLLVSSRWTDPADANRLREAIRSMNRTGSGEINTGDYRWWEEFKKADAARLALASLRRIAAEHRAPVTVQVESAPDGGNSTSLHDYVEAAQQAVRLSGSEFVLYDEDTYVHKDVTWTLGLIHDGAVDLEVAIAGSEVAPQRFQISFTDVSDLTKRIGGLIHSRVHRIRYVWPYDEKSPTVIRDVDFSVPVGTTLEARKITWLNPGRNAFREGDRFDVQVKNADFFRFALDDTRFPRAPDGAGWAYDPMSNTAFRVVLVRPAVEPFVMQALTVIFILLLASAAIACIVDLRRNEKRAAKPEGFSAVQPVVLQHPELHGPGVA